MKFITDTNGLRVLTIIAVVFFGLIHVGLWVVSNNST